MGTYILDRYVQYLKDIGTHVLPTLDPFWQSIYYARVEAMRLGEAHEREVPLGFAKVTEVTVIPAGQRKEIHALTKIRRGSYGVNLMGEVSVKHPLPLGLELKNSYCQLTPASARVNLMIENTTSRSITIPAKAIVCQLNLANRIPKLLLPTCKPEDRTEEHDNFPCSKSDLDDAGLGLTFEKVRARQVLVQDLGEDLNENYRDKTHDDGTNLKFHPSKNEQKNTLESGDCDDNGEWLLDQVDLSSLDE